MILSRRKTHFYASVVLACTLSLVFLAGLLWRPTIPVVNESVDELFAIANFATDDRTATPPDGAQRISGDGIEVFAETIAASGGAAFLEVQPVRSLQYANVLVYWQAGDRPPEAAEDATPTQTISQNAVLLGQLSGTSRRRFPLPASIQGQDGHLIFYSRGQKTLIAALPLTLASN
ncbi:hypothetical protein IQ235_08715 [Oscillatoriales cyanobacterium LEGE 11467]|uniref:Uncharacterized protein n=1 Tax=Zarconia navalis LEGE 11467 TaxID=1828826 RepID=A0A928W055_9CYAN|nr:hypothetical protein [Zarconia navalis]MBE9040860.1 hypothetical protein [Zarconia navalis LEGE 11467]